MPECKKIKAKLRKICTGDLRRLVTVNLRTLEPPPSGSADFNETFTVEESLFSLVETVSGETVFDETNTERNVTHHIYIRFILGMTAEKWVKLDGIFYDILNTENLDERNQYILLRCNKRGTDTRPVNFL